jgi:hypothetical protein
MNIPEGLWSETVANEGGRLKKKRPAPVVPGESTLGGGSGVANNKRRLKFPN